MHEADPIHRKNYTKMNTETPTSTAPDLTNTVLAECTLDCLQNTVNIDNSQVALFFQFDNDNAIEGIKCNGKEFTLKMIPVENGFIEFTDGTKRFRLFVRHC